MLQEQERAVVDARQPGPEAPVEILGFGLFANLVLDLLPLHPKRRVGKQIVEAFGLVVIFREGVAVGDV